MTRYLLLTDPKAMAGEASTTLLLGRFQPRVFIPDRATLRDLRQVIFWATGVGYLEEADFTETGLGLTFTARVKPEYLISLITATLKVGGGFVIVNKGGK